MEKHYYIFYDIMFVMHGNISHRFSYYMVFFITNAFFIVKRTVLRVSIERSNKSEITSFIFYVTVLLKIFLINMLPSLTDLYRYL